MPTKPPAGFRYRSGERRNASAQPAQQKRYVVPSCSTTCGLSARTTMLHTGSRSSVSAVLSTSMVLLHSRRPMDAREAGGCRQALTWSSVYDRGTERAMFGDGALTFQE